MSLSGFVGAGSTLQRICCDMTVLKWHSYNVVRACVGAGAYIYSVGSYMLIWVLCGMGVGGCTFSLWEGELL